MLKGCYGVHPKLDRVATKFDTVAVTLDKLYHQFDAVATQLLRGGTSLLRRCCGDATEMANLWDKDSSPHSRHTTFLWAPTLEKCVLRLAQIQRRNKHCHTIWMYNWKYRRNQLTSITHFGNDWHLYKHDRHSGKSTEIVRFGWVANLNWEIWADKLDESYAIQRNLKDRTPINSSHHLHHTSLPCQPSPTPSLSPQSKTGPCVLTGVLGYAIMHPDRLCKYGFPSHCEYHSTNRFKVLCWEPV